VLPSVPVAEEVEQFVLGGGVDALFGQGGGDTNAHVVDGMLKLRFIRVHLGNGVMNRQPDPLNITNSIELLHLAEEVHRSGTARILMRGNRELALLVPVTSPQDEQLPQAADEGRDTLLNIIGIGESAEPTDIAHHQQEYLAEAYFPAQR
jgi:hypothetical protein